MYDDPLNYDGDFWETVQVPWQEDDEEHCIFINDEVINNHLQKQLLNESINSDV